MTFKIGDELCFKDRQGMSIRKIDRITPTGILVCGDTRLNPDLSIRGAGTWDTTTVVAATDEHRANIKENNKRDSFLRIIRGTVFSNLTTAQLQKIAAVVMIEYLCSEKGNNS